MRRLNLGCGKDIRKDFVNLDVAKLPGVDVVHDVSRTPWPFKESEFDEILCRHILEHFDDMMPVLEELHRITKPDGRITIQVPYFASPGAFADPTHKRFFTYQTFRYFQPGDNLEHYTKARFRILELRLRFFTSEGLLSALSFLPDLFINAAPNVYERFLSRVLPASELIAILRPVK